MTIATLLLALVTTVPTDLGGSARTRSCSTSRPPGAAPAGRCARSSSNSSRRATRSRPVDVDQSPDLAETVPGHRRPRVHRHRPSTGRELGRIEGARPAEELADLYNQARAKFRPARRERDAGRDEPEPTPSRAATARRRPPPRRRPIPKPWETVVRIKVHGNGSIGFGSGTVIHSTPQETLILTCAHIFKLENGPTPPPSRFPRKITVDLFDGKLSGPKPTQVHYANETFAGEAVDYDFSRDVGLIRIRPGRRLPYARVVPPHWKPKANMGMITVGCSEGHDATAWSTVIVNPAMKGLNGNRTYEAIECMVAPKQGRSGGGLFTSDGYVAGVCDFAEPQGNHGLYAAPASIYKILDRNNMVALYDPSRCRAPTPLIAKNRPVARRARA